MVTSYWSFACTVEAMGTSGTPDYRTRRRQREQQRREQAHRGQAKESRLTASGAGADHRARRSAAATCGWCGGSITPRSPCRNPRWCSATCRHRAWEQARAAASGLSAVELVERRVEVQVPLVPARRAWPRLLGELAGQLNDKRVYDRDLPALARALEPVLEVYRQTSAPHRRSRPALNMSLQDFSSNQKKSLNPPVGRRQRSDACGWGSTGGVLKAALPRLYGSRHAALRD